MQVDDAPTDDYTDIGGLDKQIQELIEAVVLPMTHAERFTSIGTIVGAVVIIMIMVIVVVVMMSNEYDDDYGAAADDDDDDMMMVMMMMC